MNERKLRRLFWAAMVIVIPLALFGLVALGAVVWVILNGPPPGVRP